MNEEKKQKMEFKEEYKICYVNPYNIGPYHVARFKALSHLYPMLTLILVPNLDEKYRPWKVDKNNIPFKVIELVDENYNKQLITYKYLKEKLIKVLEMTCPDVVISVGYRCRLMRTAAHWAKARGIPTILPFESGKRDKKRVWLKERIKSFLVSRLFDAAFVGGTRNAEYIRSLGVSDKLIWRGQNVVDNDHFAVAFQKRNRSGYKKNFLTVARLSPEKNISFLLQAFYKYRLLGGDWELLIVGTGPQEDELKKNTPLSIKNAVHWLGWRQYEELPDIYASASCFILSSISEPWGLVVNEAMAAGLPILVSRNCGCLPELCWRGINGYDFDPYNIEELTSLMLKVSSYTVDLESMGKASMRIISNFTPQTWALALSDCINTLLDQRKFIH